MRKGQGRGKGLAGQWLAGAREGVLGWESHRHSWSRPATGGILHGHVPLCGADHPVRPRSDPRRSLHGHHVLPDPTVGQDPGGQGGIWRAPEGPQQGCPSAQRSLACPPCRCGGTPPPRSSTHWAAPGVASSPWHPTTSSTTTVTGEKAKPAPHQPVLPSVQPQHSSPQTPGSGAGGSLHSQEWGRRFGRDWSNGDCDSPESVKN